MEDIVRLPQMSFEQSVKTVLSKLTDFKGRARRSELWWFWLLYAIVSIILSFLLSGSYIIKSIVSILLLLSIWSVTVRRLHDRGHGGWWVAASIIINLLYSFYLSGAGYIEALSTINPDPEIAVKLMSDPVIITSMLLLFVINISIFVFCVMDSKPEENKYGPSPKYIVNYDDIQNEQINGTIYHN